MDPYKILELPRNFTVEQLRSNYKRIALKVHPDKSQLGSDYLFKLVTAAYKTLLKEWEASQADKGWGTLRAESQQYMEQEQHSGGSTVGSAAMDRQRFDPKKFNAVFERHGKLGDEERDGGYGEWMAKSTGTREDISVPTVSGVAGAGGRRFNVDKFNKAFENLPEATERRVIKHNEPEGVYNNRSIGFSDLVTTRVDDYSGENTTNKRLNYTDYKVAHTTNKLVMPARKGERKDYRNIAELEAERENISYVMSERELRAEARKKEKAAIAEQKRQHALRSRDQTVAKQYEMLSRLLLGN